MPSWPDLISAVGSEIAEHAEGSGVIFGHSLGAALALEVTAWLERRAGWRPALLVVSGTAPLPGARGARPRASSLVEDSQLIAWLRRIGGTPAEVLADPELTALALLALRADLDLVSQAPLVPSTVDVPVLAVGGVDDVSELELATWAGCTRGQCETVLLPGDHFYLQDDPEQVLVLIAHQLATTQRKAGALP